MRAIALRHLLAIPATAMLLGAAGESLAQPTTVPSDLSPGDQYRLAFLITSGMAPPLSYDIEDYNAFVTAVAAQVPELDALGTTWKAIGSTDDVDARDNTDTGTTAAHDVPRPPPAILQTARSFGCLQPGSRSQEVLTPKRKLHTLYLDSTQQIVAHVERTEGDQVYRDVAAGGL